MCCCCCCCCGLQESLVVALTQLYGAFKSTHTAMGKALSLAKNEIEDAGLFDSM
jgi:hypothetical protein